MEGSFTTTVHSDTQSVLAALFREYARDPFFAHFREGSAKFVPGDGSLRPRAIFIGEAPGVQEDRQGKPFVGASGTMLNGLLADIGLLRHECWITNVIKYRPTDNRTPTPQEIDAARPYLRREVQALAYDPLRPPPVVLLGATALRLVGDDLRVGSSHGVVLQNGRWRFLPVYHPAAALRNGKLRETMATDLLQLRKLTR